MDRPLRPDGDMRADAGYLAVEGRRVSWRLARKRQMAVAGAPSTNIHSSDGHAAATSINQYRAVAPKEQSAVYWIWILGGFCFFR